MAATKTINLIKLFLKLAVTGACLWYVSQKIDWQLTWHLVEKSNKWWLIMAALFFTASKIVSAFRLYFYFANIEVPISKLANHKLYWLGMFYNLFLPGGIGGDAYKVIILKRRYGQTAKKLSAAVLLDRISGVAGLAILLAVYYIFIYEGSQYSYAFLFAIIPGIVLYYFIVKKWFPSFLSSFWNTLWLGILVQLLQVVCVYFIMASIQLSLLNGEFIFLFLLSSVVAILPFTIGGLGAREVVFLWGSQQFLLDKNESIYISILFYLVTVLISLIGIRWMYADTLAERME